MGTLGNQIVLSRERRRFGRQCLFTDHNEMILSVQPSGRLRLKYILRNPIDERTQLSKQMALSTATTFTVGVEPHGMYHYEGGWNVKEVNVMDEEATLRYRKKIERDDSWGIEVNILLRQVMTISSQNNSINLFQDFFTDIPPDSGKGIKMPITAKSIQIYHDLWYPSRKLRACEWGTTEPWQFLLTYQDPKSALPDYNPPAMQLPDFGLENPNEFYRWDMDDSIRPVAHYNPRNWICSIAKVCMREEHYMVGGFKTGQVCFWNADENGPPKQVCPLEASHREETAALCWVHSKLNTEFYTGSLDGSVKYWDTRDLLMPVQEVLAEPWPGLEQIRQNSHGVTVLEFEYTIPVRYCIGSDMGWVFTCNRKGTVAPETIVGCFPMCVGPIRTLMRNPFFVKNFLIVGDWQMRVWSEEVKNNPSSFYFRRRHQVISGAWSTGRCSLFVLGDNRGTLEFWDLLMDQRRPIMNIKFPFPVVHLVFRPDGQVLAVSLGNGDCVLLRVEEGMRTATVKEKSLMMSMFEREISRCKLLEARVEETRLKKRLTAINIEEARKTLAKVEAKKAKKGAEKKPAEPRQEDEATILLRLIESDEEFTKALMDFNEVIDTITAKRSRRNNAIERTIFERYDIHI
ncbi:hypothetical protein KR018_009528 [Drosophila ironensis]|nr:hypothetical protein KR018_009528 [Drosophila ironensis]